jgi:hypothetical protein
MRTPPGRVGRLWLIHRIEVGHRGRDVLEQKRQAPLRQRARLEPEPAEPGRTPVQAASVRIDWRNALGRHLSHEAAPINADNGEGVGLTQRHPWAFRSKGCAGPA